MPGLVDMPIHHLSAETLEPPPFIASALKLRRGQRVHYVTCVRPDLTTPAVYETSYLPEWLFPGFLELDHEADYYALLEEKYDVAPSRSEDVFDPVKADAFLAGTLKVTTGDALLMVSGTRYLEDGTPMEYFRDYFHPLRSRIRMNFSLGGSGGRR